MKPLLPLILFAALMVLPGAYGTFPPGGGLPDLPQVSPCNPEVQKC